VARCVGGVFCAVDIDDLLENGHPVVRSLVYVLSLRAYKRWTVREKRVWYIISPLLS